MSTYMHSVDDPEQAIESINRQRTLKLAVAMGALLAILLGITATLAIAYSDAPETQPGLQSK
jgi:hypothetical protein